MEPGQIIRQARQASGVSQLTLALELGFTNGQFISNIERGLSPLPPKYVGRISDRLGIDREILIDALIAEERTQILEEVGQ